MNTVQITSLPLKRTLQDIAAGLNTECVQNGEEYSVTIPSSKGRGFITGLEIPGGMAIMLYDCVFKDDMEFHFSITEVNPLKFLFVISGTILHSFEDDQERIHKIETYQSSIVASRENHGHILNFKKDQHTRLHSLEINREKFREKMRGDIRSLPKDLQDLFYDVDAKESFYFKDHFSLDLAEMFKQMYAFEKSDFLRKLFLEGMAYQALIKQLVLYMEDKNLENEKSLLTVLDVKKIKDAVFYIDNNLMDAPSVPDIAESAGLSVPKLQQGFRILYKSTVNQYITKSRLNEARNLVLNTEYNISEIAMQIGISSKSYFSKIFREYYYLSPSQFREKNFSSIKKNIK